MRGICLNIYKENENDVMNSGYCHFIYIHAPVALVSRLSQIPFSPRESRSTTIHGSVIADCSSFPGMHWGIKDKVGWSFNKNFKYIQKVEGQESVKVCHILLKVCQVNLCQKMYGFIFKLLTSRNKSWKSVTLPMNYHLTTIPCIHFDIKFVGKVARLI